LNKQTQTHILGAVGELRERKQ